MSKLVNYRLPEPLLDALRERATDDDRTMTATVERILRDSLLSSGHLDERKKGADSASKPKPAGRNPADDDFSGDLDAYVGKYPPGQVKRGDE